MKQLIIAGRKVVGVIYYVGGARFTLFPDYVIGIDALGLVVDSPNLGLNLLPWGHLIIELEPNEEDLERRKVVNGSEG